mmetsp:Transcript_17359/g.49571  ORF Transcript_17359/g.49571 Transcript_17359/m.49571 type:complete len:220 (-) Transcript_17359:312-971(-)
MHRAQIRPASLEHRPREARHHRLRFLPRPDRGDGQKARRLGARHVHARTRLVEEISNGLADVVVARLEVPLERLSGWRVPPRTAHGRVKGRERAQREQCQGGGYLSPRQRVLAAVVLAAVNEVCRAYSQKMLDALYIFFHVISCLYRGGAHNLDGEVTRSPRFIRSKAVGARAAHDVVHGVHREHRGRAGPGAGEVLVDIACDIAVLRVRELRVRAEQQ